MATIVLESTPWHDDITQSLECKSFFLKLILTPFPPDYGFSAYENSLNLQREYYQQFACEFDLVYYPFDTQARWWIRSFLFYTLQQVCHMVFALQGFTKEFIAMDGDGIGVEYLGKTDNEARDI